MVTSRLVCSKVPTREKVFVRSGCVIQQYPIENELMFRQTRCVLIVGVVYLYLQKKTSLFLLSIAEVRDEGFRLGTVSKSQNFKCQANDVCHLGIIVEHHVRGKASLSQRIGQGELGHMVESVFLDRGEFLSLSICGAFLSYPHGSGIGLGSSIGLFGRNFREALAEF
jgi:hypothetical protein